MKKRMGVILIATAFLFVWAVADLGADPPNFNDLIEECPENRCGNPPTGGIPGGGGAGGVFILVDYNWGPYLSVQEDIDFDGHNDTDDNCRHDPNSPFDNMDGDAYGDECDKCDEDFTETNFDDDGDGVGDDCDDDIDGDEVLNDVDTCPYDWNPQQNDPAANDDPDGDGMGNACDGDDDNDGIPDLLDNCTTDRNADQANSDGYLDEDVDGDACDDDYDNDGLDEGNGNIPGEDLCPRMLSYENGDADGDGVGNPCDNCPNDPNPNQADTNKNGIGDECDA